MWSVLIALVLLTTGCPFGPGLPVEDKFNYPSLISEEFARPSVRVLQVQRSDPLLLEFSITNFLDINEDETLEVFWFAPGIGSGQVLGTDISRQEAGAGLYRNLFTVYEGSSININPCDSKWINQDKLVLSVFVSDGKILFENNRLINENEDSFIDSYTWTIRFEGTCI